MLKWIVIPLGGGHYADITLLVIAIIIIVGCLWAHIHFTRRDVREYEKKLAQRHSSESNE